jgi:hypothetical protein
MEPAFPQITRRGLDMEITRRSYPVQVITTTHAITGIYQPIGNFMVAINNPDSTCLPLSEATFTPLATGAPLRSITVPEATVNKRDILFVCFPDDTVQRELNMFKRVARLIAYTPAFVLRAEFHLGAEDQVGEMLDTLRGQFQPLTDVTIFPLLELQVSLDRQHDLVVINSQAITIYHAETTQ